MRFHGAGLGFVLLLAGAAFAQQIDMEVELLGPLGTETNRKGDQISARVISPDTFKGDIVQGKVTESRAGGKMRGQAVLNFTFETLQHGGQAVPIASEIKSVSNSKGQVDVDEEGRVIRKTSNVGKAIGGTAIGGLIGGIAGGAKGAAIGAAAGAAISIVMIQVVAQGPSVRFDPGSKILLSVQSRNKDVPLTSLAANPAPEAAPAPAAAAAPAAEAAPAAAPAQAVPAQAAASPAGSAQPDLTAIKADFVPGEKVLFYDDFTDMAGDEPPPHWKVRGTTAELQVGPGIRQLTVKGETVTLTPNLRNLPKNFTMEMDLTIPAQPIDTRPELSWRFLNKDGQDVMVLDTKQNGGNDWWLRVRVGEETLGENTFPVNWSQVAKLALWVQNGRVRLYLNGQRLFDVNQVNLAEIVTVENRMWTGDKPVGYRFARFAESMPDFSQVIASSGRYVSHGILFDTDSDRLKPESAAVIKTVAAALTKNPNLKLRIEGHTDAVGNADHNLDLSKRRAEAVKAVLVSQFGVEDARLTSDGLGAAKPIDSNDTPQGRAQNRRVEFVRQ